MKELFTGDFQSAVVVKMNLSLLNNNKLRDTSIDLTFSFSNDVFVKLEFSLDDETNHYLVAIDADISCVLGIVEQTICQSSQTLIGQKIDGASNKVPSETILTCKSSLYALLAHSEKQRIYVSNPEGKLCAAFNVDMDASFFGFEHGDMSLALEELDLCLRKLRQTQVPKGLDQVSHRNFILQSARQLIKKRMLKVSSWSKEEMCNFRETLCYLSHLDELNTVA
jgi:hypothetical protein